MKSRYYNSLSAISQNGNRSVVASAVDSLFKSENPGKWVAGIAIGALAVSALAIKAIVDVGK